MKDMITISTIINNENIDEFNESIKGIMLKIEKEVLISENLIELLLIVKNDDGLDMQDVKERSNLALLKTIINEKSKQYISIKVAQTHKRSKDYALLNIAWQAGTGDIILFHESPAVLASDMDLIINEFDYTSSNGCFITYDEDGDKSNFIQAKESPNRTSLYKEINQSYFNVSKPDIILPIFTRGWIANRKMINVAFSSQKEHYEPYIALAICGLDKTDIIVKSTSKSAKQSDYDKQHRKELRAMYTNHNHNSFVKKIRNKAILFSMLLTFVLIVHNQLLFEISIPKSTQALGILVLMMIGYKVIIDISSHLDDMMIIQKQALASSLNKSVVGQFEIEKIL